MTHFVSLIGVGVLDVLWWLGSNWHFNTQALSGEPLRPIEYVSAFVRLLLIACAAWRAAYMFVVEDGPWGLIDRLRNLRGVVRMGEGVSGPAYTAFMCIKCMSIWVAAELLFMPWQVSAWLAMSALVFIVHTKTAGRFM